MSVTDIKRDMKYLDLHTLNISSASDEPWFKDAIMKLSMTAYHLWTYGEFDTWYYGQDDLRATCEKGDFEALTSYSLPYLSPCEYDDLDHTIQKYKSMKIPEYEKRALEDHKVFVTEHNVKMDLCQKAQDKSKPEWYCMPHHCQRLNGLITLPLMQYLHPEIQWHFIDAKHHAFVTNTLDLHESSIFEKTTNLAEPLIVDFYWGNVEAPFEYVGLDDKKIFNDSEKAKKHVMVNY